MTRSKAQSDAPAFLETFGRLPRTWLIIGATVIAGLSEGFGLALFIPLLEIMGNTGHKTTRLFESIETAFQTLGLPVTLITLLIAIVVLILGAFALIYLQRRLVFTAKNAFVRDLRARFARGILEADWTYLSQQSTGELLNQTSVESTRAGNGMMVQTLFAATAIQVAILALVSSALSWQLFVIAMIFAALMILPTRPLVHRAARLGDATSTANRNFNFHLVDYFRGAKLIKIAAAEVPFLQRINQFNDALYRVQRNFDLNSALTHFLLQVTPVIVLAVIIAVAHEYVGLAASHILVFLLLLARLAPRVAEMQQRYEDYRYLIPGLVAMDRMLADCDARREDLRPDGRPFDKLRDGISVEDVRYRYDGGAGAALNGASLRIGRNQMVAVVGSSGGGKSTLIDVIAGLRNAYEGRVMVDGTELRELDLRSWRKRISYVTQDVFVFNDTLRNNLLFARADATDAEIEDALRLARLTDIVADQPQGLDTDIGENGARISGGQRQRVALARALLARPELLLLDEATSALDNESERLVQEALDSIARTLTVVVIAHRLPTVRKADIIYVMEDGRIVESGNYEELLAKGGRFSELHRLQFA